MSGRPPSVLPTGIQTLDSAMALVNDRERSLEDRTAAYAVLHQAQLRVNRALKAAKDDLVLGIKDAGGRLGPVSLTWTAFDVHYECNGAGSWEDATVQDAMAALRSSQQTGRYVREIPSHLEIDVAALSEDLQLGVTAAHELYAQLREHRWRTEGGRRASLKVDEAKARKEAA